MSSRHLGLLLAAIVVSEIAGRSQWSDYFAATPRFLRWSVYYATLIIIALSYKSTMTFIYAQF
jgi:hypothetical protein